MLQVAKERLCLKSYLCDLVEIEKDYFATTVLPDRVALTQG